MAASLEAALAQGVKEGKIPHAIVCATNKDGSFEYHHATGFQNYGVNDDPIQEDAVLMLASQTKLLTSIAALKVVEQGLIGLDEDVCPHLPELAAHKIIQGFDENDKPKLVERKGPITIRQLLTHSSGTTYAFPGTDAMKYDVQRGRKHPDVSLAPTIAERCDTTMIFEPGTSWMYSPGLDWAGLLIQRLSKLSLDDYMQQHLFQPLGITAITFWPAQREDLKDKIAGLVVRTPEGKLVPNTNPTINTGTTDCFGGHGAYAKMGDYLKVMRSLLANDGKLLTPASVDMMFEPQLGDDSKAAVNGFIKAFSAGLPGEFEDDVPVDHGLGGLLFLKDGDGRRKKGTLGWGGYFNPFWIIDREANLAFTMGLQLVPPGDPGCKEMTGVAERAIYKMAGVS